MLQRYISEQRNCIYISIMLRQLAYSDLITENNLKYQSEAVKYSKDELVAILSTYNRTLNNIGDDITIIRDWLKLQKHILIETTDREILYFLISCKFSFEKTKEKLNMYYCIRNILPEYYKSCTGSTKQIQIMFSAVNLLPLPNLTPELNRVVIYSIVDNKNSGRVGSDFLNSFVAFILDTQPIFDLCLSNECIFDLSNSSFDFVMKYSIMDLKKMLTIIEKVYSSRVARIHIINAPGYCNTLISVVKTFLKDKMKKRLLMHKSYEALYDYIPKAILPSDFGGNGNSLAEMKAIFQKSLLDYDEHFEKINGNAVDENLRPKNLINDEILGFYGSFKKLQVD